MRQNLYSKILDAEKKLTGRETSEHLAEGITKLRPTIGKGKIIGVPVGEKRHADRTPPIRKQNGKD